MPPSLPNELFNQILLHASPSALAILCRTSKTTLPLARTKLYRHITITFSWEVSEDFQNHGAPDSDSDADSVASSINYWWYNADEALCHCLRRYKRLADLVETITVTTDSRSRISSDDGQVPRVVKQLLRSCLNVQEFHMDLREEVDYDMEMTASAASTALVARERPLDIRALTLDYSGYNCLRLLDVLPGLQKLTLKSNSGLHQDLDGLCPSSFDFRLHSLRLKSTELAHYTLGALLKNSRPTLHTLELPAHDQTRADVSRHLQHLTALPSLTLALKGIDESANLLPSLFRTLRDRNPNLAHLHLSHWYIDYTTTSYDFFSTEPSPPPKPVYLDSALLLLLPRSIQSLELSIMPVTPQDLTVLVNSGRRPRLKSIKLSRTLEARGTEKEWIAAVKTARKAGVELHRWIEPVWEDI